MSQKTTVVRLSPEVYEALVKTLPPVYVSNETTAHQAGYQLGIQLVLSKLREGYVVQAS